MLDLTTRLKKLRHACVIVVSIQLIFGFDAKTADILESASVGGASTNNWNSIWQWTGESVPTSGNNYVLYTNTANDSKMSSYYGVSFGTGYIRTANGTSVDVFGGGAIIVPPATEILMKNQFPSGIASANIVFTNYNNLGAEDAAGVYPLIRLGANNSGTGTVTLDGTIKVAADAYIANDYGIAGVYFKIASAVSGTSNLFFISSKASGSTFSSTQTNLLTGDWSGFAGRLNIGNSTVAATVEMNNSAVNTNMSLAMPRANGVLILDKAINVKSFSIANNSVPAGTYTPEQLTALGFGGRFSGSGSLSVASDSIYPPQGLVATPGDAKVVLSWRFVHGAASYNVKRSTVSGSEITIANLTGTNYSDTGLINGTTYYYQVSALDGGNNESGNSVEVSVAPQVPRDYPKILKVYLQGGQSNSDGRAMTNNLPVKLLQPQGDIPIYNYLAGAAANGDGSLGQLTILQPGLSIPPSGNATLFGPELTFGRALADYYALTNGTSTNAIMVAIIKYAHGGTSLVADWVANGNSSTNGDGPDYVTFQKVVSAGLSRLAEAFPAASIELDGMIWVQGESDIDAGFSASAAYGTNLVRFINDVRLTYATNWPYGTSLPFFFSRISANQTVYSLPSDSSYSNYLLLRAGQQFAATNQTNVFMIDTDPPQFSTTTPWSSPGLHFDTQGQQSLGMAFGQSVTKTLPLSVLQTPQRIGEGCRLNFTGVSGTLNSIQRSEEVTGPWTLLTNLLIGTSWTTNWIDPNPPNAAGFYRIYRP
jgi:hypothetical protein